MSGVLIGQRGTDFGVWIGRPGYDVETCGPEGLLYSMGGQVGVLTESHHINLSPQFNPYTYDLAISDQGFSPYVLWLQQAYSGATGWFDLFVQPDLEIVSNTLLRFHNMQPSGFNDRRLLAWVTSIDFSDYL